MADSNRPLSTALGIDGGIVCAVGAGGKKSLLYALADENAGRIGLTATAMTLRFPARFRTHMRIDDDVRLQQALAQPGEVGVFAYACPSEKPGRLAGVQPETVAAIHAGGDFVLTLVKADGARMRGIKAPKPGEPLVVPGADYLVPVVSAGVIGQPLDDRVAHRVERLAEVLDSAPGATLTATDIGRLLAAEHGGLRGAAKATVVPVINQVDDAKRREAALEAARIALAASNRFDRVVLTSLVRDNPVVDVVRRNGW